jgi:hypothetical protein
LHIITKNVKCISIMGRLRDVVVLPSRLDAIDTVTCFTGLEAGAVDDHLKLANALGGMASALTTLTLEYSSAGLWTEIGDSDNRHKFASEPQDRIGYGGASLQRTAGRARTDQFLRRIIVPSDNLLRHFIEADPATLRQGWDRPSRYDIYAKAITTEGGVRTDAEHWPFHLPVNRPAGYSTSPAEDASGYARILQGLSATFLEIIL